MKITFQAFIFLIILVSTTVARQFSIDGTRILDPYGNEFIPKGVNVNGPHWPWERSTLRDTSLIINRWNFNTVRVNCMPRLEHTFPDNNPDLDAIVEGFTSRKVVTIIENHDYTGDYPQGKDLEELKSWWIDKASRYKDNPYVWFNIMNEPGPNLDTVPELWKTTHEKVIQAIRNTGANNLIILDGHQYGQENGFKSVEGSGILTYGPYFKQHYSNIGFSVHMYSRWNYGKDEFRAYVDSVHARNLNLHVGEYGSAPHYCKGVAAAMFSVAIPEKVGRIVWQWDGSDVHDLTEGDQQGGGWEINNSNGDKPDNLSYVGNLIWEDNHGRLTPDDKILKDIPGPWLYNGGFEEEDAEWILFGSNGIENSSSDVHSGDRALRINSGAMGGAVQNVFLMPDSAYVFSAWGKVSNSGGSGEVTLRYTPEGEAEISQTLKFDETSYTHKEVEFTMPPDPEEASILVYKGENEAELFTDDIQVILKSKATSLKEPKNSLREKIFPNPADERCFVPVKKQVSPERIEIFDMEGRKYYAPVSNINDNTARINVSNLKSGMYMVRVVYKNYSKTHKFIINR